MANSMIFSVLLTIFIFFNRLIRLAKYCFTTPAHKEQCYSGINAKGYNNDTIRATPRYRPCKKIQFWTRLAELVLP